MGSLVPWDKVSPTVYLSETFDAWASNGWVETLEGDPGSLWGANGHFAASAIGGSEVTSSKLVRTFGAGDGLPPNALVRIAIGLDWNLGAGAPGGPGPVVDGLLFGGWVADEFQQLPGPALFSEGAGVLTWLARTNGSGELVVEVGAEGMVGTFNLDGAFNSIEVTSVIGDFADIIIDSAVLIVDGMQLTISRGGWSFDPGEEWEDYMFPGRTMNVKGCRELVRLKPTIRGSAMMAGEVQISAYRPDGTWADHATVAGARTFTPNALRSYLTSTDYLQHVFIVWKRLRGDYIAVEFPVGVCGGYSIGSQDGDEGLFPLTIEAVQDLSTGTTKTAVPYRIHTLPGTTEVSDLPAGSDS